MSIPNFFISTGKVDSINRKHDSKLQSVKRDRYLFFIYLIMENTASHIYVLPKRTRIFLAISRMLACAPVDFHTSIKSKLFNNKILTEYLSVCSFSTFFINASTVSHLLSFPLTAAHLPSDGCRLRTPDLDHFWVMSFLLVRHVPRLISWERRTTIANRHTLRRFISRYTHTLYI